MAQARTASVRTRDLARAADALLQRWSTGELLFPGGLVLVGIIVAFHAALIELLLVAAALEHASLSLAIGLLAAGVAAFVRLRGGLEHAVHDSAVDHTLGRAYGIGLLTLSGVLIAVMPSGQSIAPVWLAFGPLSGGLVALAFGMRGLKTLRLELSLVVILCVGRAVLPVDTAVIHLSLPPMAAGCVALMHPHQRRRASIDPASSDGRWPASRRWRSLVLGLLVSVAIGFAIR